LGSGDFVDGLKHEEMLRDKMKSAVTIARLVAAVATALCGPWGQVRVSDIYTFHFGKYPKV